MSKLPVISGADCVKALTKIGFEVHRQRGSHIVVVRKSPPSQTTIPNHKELDRGRCALSFDKPGSQSKSSSHYCRVSTDLLPAMFHCGPVRRGRPRTTALRQKSFRYSFQKLLSDVVSARGAVRRPVDQKPDNCIYARSSVGARPSSAAPVA